MYGTMVIITKKEVLTEKEIDNAIHKFSYYAKVAEHKYGTIEEFRRCFDYCKEELKIWGTEEFKKMHPKVNPETIKNDDLVRYIEENWSNDYRVEGNIVYSTMNDIDCLFDFWDMPVPVEQYFLFTKDKKKVSSCKTTDWDLIGKGATVFEGVTIDNKGNAKGAGKEYVVEKMVYDLIYDYDNDTMEGINYKTSDEEWTDWNNNFDKNAAKYVSEDTYAHVVKYHF